MKSLWILVGASLAVLGPSSVRAEDKPPAGAAAKERVELAKKFYKDQILRDLARRLAPPDQGKGPIEDLFLTESMAEALHTWSVRWMEAERDGAVDQTGRIAAVQAHLDRMISVEAGKMTRKELADHPFVKEADESNRSMFVDLDPEKVREAFPEVTRRFSDVARYFRLEAEAWLAKEKAGR